LELCSSNYLPLYLCFISEIFLDKNFIEYSRFQNRQKSMMNSYLVCERSFEKKEERGGFSKKTFGG
jgi:hypothetical protein